MCYIYFTCSFTVYTEILVAFVGFLSPKMANIVPSTLARGLSSGVANRILAKKYVLTKHFEGEPKKSDFIVVEEELPQLKDGGIVL